MLSGGGGNGSKRKIGNSVKVVTVISTATNNVGRQFRRVVVNSSSRSSNAVYVVIWDNRAHILVTILILVPASIVPNIIIIDHFDRTERGLKTTGS